MNKLKLMSLWFLTLFCLGLAPHSPFPSGNQWFDKIPNPIRLALWKKVKTLQDQVPPKETGVQIANWSRSFHSSKKPDITPSIFQTHSIQYYEQIGIFNISGVLEVFSHEIEDQPMPVGAVLVWSQMPPIQEENHPSFFHYLENDSNYQQHRRQQFETLLIGLKINFTKDEEQTTYFISTEGLKKWNHFYDLAHDFLNREKNSNGSSSIIDQLSDLLTGRHLSPYQEMLSMFSDQIPQAEQEEVLIAYLTEFLRYQIDIQNIFLYERPRSGLPHFAFIGLLVEMITHLNDVRASADSFFDNPVKEPTDILSYVTKNHLIGFVSLFQDWQKRMLQNHTHLSMDGFMATSTRVKSGVLFWGEKILNQIYFLDSPQEKELETNMFHQMSHIIQSLLSGQMSRELQITMKDYIYSQYQRKVHTIPQNFRIQFALDIFQTFFINYKKYHTLMLLLSLNLDPARMQKIAESLYQDLIFFENLFEILEPYLLRLGDEYLQDIFEFKATLFHLKINLESFRKGYTQPSDQRMTWIEDRMRNQRMGLTQPLFLELARNPFQTFSDDFVLTTIEKSLPLADFFLIFDADPILGKSFFLWRKNWPTPLMSVQLHHLELLARQSILNAPYAYQHLLYAFMVSYVAETKNYLPENKRLAGMQSEILDMYRKMFQTISQLAIYRQAEAESSQTQVYIESPSSDFEITHRMQEINRLSNAAFIFMFRFENQQRRPLSISHADPEDAFQYEKQFLFELLLAEERKEKPQRDFDLIILASKYFLNLQDNNQLSSKHIQDCQQWIQKLIELQMPDTLILELLQALYAEQNPLTLIVCQELENHFSKLKNHHLYPQSTKWIQRNLNPSVSHPINIHEGFLFYQLNQKQYAHVFEYLHLIQTIKGDTFPTNWPQKTTSSPELAQFFETKYLIDEIIKTQIQALFDISKLKYESNLQEQLSSLWEQVNEQISKSTTLTSETDLSWIDHYKNQPFIYERITEHIQTQITNLLQDSLMTINRGSNIWNHWLNLYQQLNPALKLLQSLMSLTPDSSNFQNNSLEIDFLKTIATIQNEFEKPIDQSSIPDLLAWIDKYQEKLLERAPTIKPTKGKNLKRKKRKIQSNDTSHPHYLKNEIQNEIAKIKQSWIQKQKVEEQIYLQAERILNKLLTIEASPTSLDQYFIDIEDTLQNWLTISQQHPHIINQLFTNNSQYYHQWASIEKVTDNLNQWQQIIKSQYREALALLQSFKEHDRETLSLETLSQTLIKLHQLDQKTWNEFLALILSQLESDYEILYHQIYPSLSRNDYQLLSDEIYQKIRHLSFLSDQLLQLFQTQIPIPNHKIQQLLQIQSLTHASRMIHLIKYHRFATELQVMAERNYLKEWEEFPLNYSQKPKVTPQENQTVTISLKAFEYLTEDLDFDYASRAHNELLKRARRRFMIGRQISFEKQLETGQKKKPDVIKTPIFEIVEVTDDGQLLLKLINQHQFTESLPEIINRMIGSKGIMKVRSMNPLQGQWSLLNRIVESLTDQVRNGALERTVSPNQQKAIQLPHDQSFHPMLNALLGLSTSDHGELLSPLHSIEISSLSMIDLNEEQQKIPQGVAGAQKEPNAINRLLIVLAPGGTGKTHTLTATNRRMQDRQTILVTAPTHAAVDNAFQNHLHQGIPADRLIRLAHSNHEASIHPDVRPHWMDPDKEEHLKALMTQQKPFIVFTTLTGMWGDQTYRNLQRQISRESSNRQASTTLSEPEIKPHIIQVDECGMLSFAELLFFIQQVASPNTTVILYGDYHQLRPYGMGQDALEMIHQFIGSSYEGVDLDAKIFQEAAQDTLRESPLEVLHGRSANHSFILTRNYRSESQIIELLNQLIYQPQHATMLPGKTHDSVDTDDQVLFLPVDNSRFDDYRRDANQQKIPSQPIELEEIRQILWQMNQDIEKYQLQSHEITFIAGYKSQLEIFEASLWTMALLQELYNIQKNKEEWSPPDAMNDIVDLIENLLLEFNPRAKTRFLDEIRQGHVHSKNVRRLISDFRRALPQHLQRLRLDFISLSHFRNGFGIDDPFLDLEEQAEIQNGGTSTIHKIQGRQNKAIYFSLTRNNSKGQVGYFKYRNGLNMIVTALGRAQLLLRVSGNERTWKIAAQKGYISAIKLMELIQWTQKQKQPLNLETYLTIAA